mmetsp:Transcript_8690/g.16116  ORF Transcript_8690/g.16116 Transcript_8690/m.16116 type:complete len:127 (+) Transcript_8690:56-436(+)
MGTENELDQAAAKMQAIVRGVIIRNRFVHDMRVLYSRQCQLVQPDVCQPSWRLYSQLCAPIWESNEIFQSCKMETTGENRDERMCKEKERLERLEEQKLKLKEELEETQRALLERVQVLLNVSGSR